MLSATEQRQTVLKPHGPKPKVEAVNKGFDRLDFTSYRATGGSFLFSFSRLGIAGQLS